MSLEAPTADAASADPGAASPASPARQRLRRVLRDTPMFGELTAQARDSIERKAMLRVLPGGAPLFHPGDLADAIYIVGSGCLGVFRYDPDNPSEGPSLIAEVTAGSLVGEMSLLAEGKRVRGVAALRDSELWRLSREDFRALSHEHPEILPPLMRGVMARTALEWGTHRRQPRTFAVLPTGHDVSAARFAVLLSAALSRLGSSVQMLGPDSLGRDPEWFARCEMDSAFVLYRADPTATEWTQLCLRQADCIVVVRNADQAVPTRVPFEIEPARPGAVFHRRRELVLLHEGHDPAPNSSAPMLAGGLYGQHHHVRLDIHGDFDRLARLLTGHAVGVVMAGGGARAFSHIGVVKALRASGVPIDLVGGTSMGAVVAAAVASRWDEVQVVDHFRQAFVTTNPLSDYTLPLISLYGGHRVTRLLRDSFGEKDIEDLVLPFFCITANLTTSLADVHPVGRLWRWLRASVAIPGVVPPFNEAGEVHVDGGVIDNFPVREMHRLGRGTTIGVDIDTGGAFAAGADVTEPWSASQFFRRLLWHRNETLPIPSIVRILLRSALVASTARAIEDRAAADLLIVPPISDIDLLDWTKFDTAIEAGYRTTMEALDRARTLPVGARLFVA
ncbi:MAG: cyclic nucleotide-binding and patatin-like phospholipase domain-containing protein [Reyranellaceae bacterium]